MCRFCLAFMAQAINFKIVACNGEILVDKLGGEVFQGAVC